MAVPSIDLDPHFVGSEPGALAPGRLDGRLEAAFARALWQAARPDWTHAGWDAADLRPEVRELLWLQVGLGLQQRLLDLAAADRAAGYRRGHCPHRHAVPTMNEHIGIPGYPCSCQVVTVGAWSAVASWVAHRVEREVVAVAGDEPVEGYPVPDRPELGTITDPAVEELAPALRVSPGGARYRLAGLRRIAALPRLREAIESGLVIGWHAHQLATDLRHLPESDQRRVIHVLLDRLRQRRGRGLREWTSSDLRTQAKRIAARLNLDLTARRQACHRGRGVRLRLHGQGSATITADLADDVASRIFNRITAIAHGLDDECDDHSPGGEGPRTLEQRRADVFTDLLLGAPPSDRGADANTAPATVAGAEIGVVIDLATLLRLAENPAEIPGLGPIPADIARDLAADARWRAWITTTTDVGTRVVATSPGTYRPSAALARLIRAREPECRMPGCQSRITDLDHVIPFPHGQTTEANLGPLCRRHHRLKTHTRWRQHVHESGDHDSLSATGANTAPMWTWTDPAGITHTDVPDSPLP